MALTLTLILMVMIAIVRAEVFTTVDVHKSLASSWSSGALFAAPACCFCVVKYFRVEFLFRIVE